GTELTLEAVPADGYKLVAVTANGEVVEGTTYTVVSDVTFGATFSNESYALTVVNDANLEYTLTQNGVAVTDLAALVGGAEYKLTVNVPEEYTLNGVTLNDEALTATDGAYTFTMSQASTLVISATEKAKYTVTVTPSAKGTITVTANGAAVASGATVLDGTVLTISAVAEQGWRVASISANGTTVANNGTYTVNGNVTISATYEEQTIDYCVPQPVSGRPNSSEHNNSQRHRYLTQSTISNGTNSVVISNSGDYANRTFTSSMPRPVYDEQAVVPQLEVAAGDVITITAVGEGSWNYTDLYLDADANGLDIGDRVYTNRPASGEVGRDVAGTFTFTVPSNLKPGTYRMRHMTDWDGVSPCQYGQTTFDNGEFIYDVDLVIPAQELDQERTVTVATENEAYGTVAILDPATEETSVTTKQVDVVVLATPAQGYAFLNWTNATGAIESTGARYTYEGEADVELTAHFGHSVSYTVSGQGSFSATTAEGASISNGQVLPVGTEVTFTLTPAAGKCVAVFAVNGESKASALVDNQYTVTLEDNVSVIVDFADFTAHVSWVVNGNGEVAAGYDFNDEMDGPAVEFGNGDMLSANQFNESGFNLYAYPGAVEGSEGEYETIENVTLQTGDADPVDIKEEVLAGADLGMEENGLREDGSPVYYYAVSELPSADLMVVFVFSEGGESAAIDNIFGDDNNDDEPTLFYNLEGARVNGNALTPGIYIAKKGKKAAKVYVM
ncbi:MAG: lytic polysaccharide monooxygenase auxiliary activity family 9 protein, partial [Paramuribaculum sp.]|nr:lytic polysaccharide monooxygenase auxiliary activity family 9 protein [Paramuribaculum sp.]